MLFVGFEDLRFRVEKVLLRSGLSPEGSSRSARMIVEADRDGVRTHGIARLPRFVEMVRRGRIDPTAQPERVVAAGALERWSGRRGPGNLAAYLATERAVALAREFGVGAVALGDTTHWQRGGTYGWQAAEAGCALLAWTNTLPNMPPWGVKSAAVGNNPLVIAVPHQPAPIVLDIAMSQFSYGGLASYREREEQLPVPGGFDETGELTRDPSAIERTQRALPIGFWKGSGLAFVLDVLGAMLAGGRATHEIARDPLEEVGLSQMFIAVHPEAVSSLAEMQELADRCVAALHAAEPVLPGVRPRYPGEGTLRVREESLRRGVGVDEAVWNDFVGLEDVVDGRS